MPDLFQKLGLSSKGFDLLTSGWPTSSFRNTRDRRVNTDHKWTTCSLPFPSALHWGPTPYPRLLIQVLGTDVQASQRPPRFSFSQAKVQEITIRFRGEVPGVGKELHPSFVHIPDLGCMRLTLIICLTTAYPWPTSPLVIMIGG